jgi:hypothetical protein
MDMHGLTVCEGRTIWRAINDSIDNRLLVGSGTLYSLVGAWGGVVVKALRY